MRNNFKRLICYIVCMCIVISFAGCGKESKKVNKEEAIPTLSPFATQEEIDEYYKKLASHIKVKKEKGDYKYTQEKNVLNDKYRNYYQIMVATFCDSNGDGIGDLNGIISKLDYIQDLGYNGIWLTPIMESSEYHKYAISDFMTVDKDFGTVEDFKKLADECKKRNISLILDLVLNHTSTSHPWFTKAKMNMNNNNKYYKQLNKNG